MLRMALNYHKTHLFRNLPNLAYTIYDFPRSVTLFRQPCQSCPLPITSTAHAPKQCMSHTHNVTHAPTTFVIPHNVLHIPTKYYRPPQHTTWSHHILHTPTTCYTSPQCTIRPYNMIYGPRIPTRWEMTQNCLGIDCVCHVTSRPKGDL